MKINHFVLFVLILFAVSCSKNNDTKTQPPAGYLFNYLKRKHLELSPNRFLTAATPVNSDYTITSTSKDTSINGRSYHVYNNSAGGNQYLNISGNDYYQYDSLNLGVVKAVIERLYLKDNAAVGTTWNQSKPLIFLDFLCQYRLN